MANRSGYSDSELLKMQADAVRRVKEMQRRQADAVSTSENRPRAQQPVQNPSPARARRENPPFQRRYSRPQKKEQEKAAEPKKEEKSSRGLADLLSPLGSLSGLFDGIKLDSDTLMLLGLAYLLYKNGASYKLILSLLYIML